MKIKKNNVRVLAATHPAVKKRDLHLSDPRHGMLVEEGGKERRKEGGIKKGASREETAGREHRRGCGEGRTGAHRRGRGRQLCLASRLRVSLSVAHSHSHTHTHTTLHSHHHSPPLCTHSLVLSNHRLHRHSSALFPSPCLSLRHHLPFSAHSDHGYYD